MAPGRYDVEGLPEPAKCERGMSRMRVDPRSMAPLIDVAFDNKVNFLASALGTPPAWLIERCRAAGIPVSVFPHGTSLRVAEHNLALIFGLARGLTGRRQRPLYPRGYDLT